MLPIRIAYLLGRRYVLLDAVYSAIQVLGARQESMDSWKRLVERIPVDVTLEHSRSRWTPGSGWLNAYLWMLPLSTPKATEPGIMMMMVMKGHSETGVIYAYTFELLQIASNKYRRIWYLPLYFCRCTVCNTISNHSNGNSNRRQYSGEAEEKTALAGIPGPVLAVLAGEQPQQQQPQQQQPQQQQRQQQQPQQESGCSSLRLLSNRLISQARAHRSANDSNKKNRGSNRSMQMKTGDGCYSYHPHRYHQGNQRKQQQRQQHQVASSLLGVEAIEDEKAVRLGGVEQIAGQGAGVEAFNPAVSVEISGLARGAQGDRLVGLNRPEEGGGVESLATVAMPVETTGLAGGAGRDKLVTLNRPEETGEAAGAFSLVSGTGAPSFSVVVQSGI
ncbi:LOW QUALITY PROTEIN: uncharacterized protein EMH_0003460 [Eimeria mitis]|uniref:Uncharacterized protein n=1 Tax=Eimeria mitis TaxID=44415 RepID=U6K0H5_9EIME|nr:LOW QUALITY PROTEIN: uncharacterized protein EMH_0003460 [Eimeria mitis]CDJ29263.1 hypothetical protein EMH_0003460 [Eimeria mitis]